MKTFSLCALALLFATVPLGATGNTTTQYGKIVVFKKDLWINYPDFRIRFTGERHVDVPNFKPSFRYLDFEVASNGILRKISWSSGTGEIAPVLFKVEGKEFFLELKASLLKKGFMLDSEMVIWPKAEFLRKAEERTSR